MFTKRSYSRRNKPKQSNWLESGEQTKENSFIPPIQTKLKVGEPGDTFEIEAEKTADKVVNKTSSESGIQKMQDDKENDQTIVGNDITPFVQKAEEEEPVQKKEEEEPVQKMEEEKKEDPVQKMEEEEPVQKMEEEKKEEPVQKMEEEEPVQKMEEEKKEETQGQSSSRTSKNISGNIEANFKNSSGGRKLDKSTRSEMEAGFGVDFDHVKIHTDNKAVQMNQELGAKAFTHGNDVYFNEGKYNPNSKDGKHLIAHELTHTIQQGASNKMIQAEFAVEPTTPDRPTRDLSEREMQRAIEFNQARHTDAQEIALIRSILSASSEPAVIDEDFVNAVVRYQAQYGLARDGKIGGATADRLAKEMIGEADLLGEEDLGTLGPQFVLQTNIQALVDANSAVYADYNAAIGAGTMIQRFIVLNNKPLLRQMRGALSWNNFARCIELLGYQAPTYATLIANGRVRAALQSAWDDSDAAINPPVTTQHEEGGWVYLNLITGNLSITRQARGATAAINLSAPPLVHNSVVVAKFHTHPNLRNPAGGRRWMSGPGSRDRTVDARHGVPDIVVGSPDTDPTTYELYPSGPNRRRHLAGNRGLPGATGGLSPQEVK